MPGANARQRQLLLLLLCIACQLPGFRLLLLCSVVVQHLGARLDHVPAALLRAHTLNVLQARDQGSGWQREWEMMSQHRQQSSHAPRQRRCFRCAS